MRALTYTTCFSEATDRRVAEYRPLFYFSDADKQEYKEHFGLKYSDCYEIWGFTRTGCCCCPFGSAFEHELEVIKKFEPKLYTVVNKIFGASYDYTRRYREFKEVFKRERRKQRKLEKEIENHE